MHRATLLLLSLTQACSVASVRPVPDDHRDLTHFDCTSDNIAPASDVMWAAFDSLLAGIAAAAEDDNGKSDPQTGFVVLFGGLAAIHTVSAVVGYGKTSECRAAKDELGQRNAHGERDMEERIRRLETEIQMPTQVPPPPPPSPPEPPAQAPPPPEPNPASEAEGTET